MLLCFGKLAKAFELYSPSVEDVFACDFSVLCTVLKSTDKTIIGVKQNVKKALTNEYLSTKREYVYWRCQKH